MRVVYTCRHCHSWVGELTRPGWTREDAEALCGLNQLSSVERTEAIDYNGVEDTLYVKTVCPYCQDAAEANPALLVEGKLLQ